MTTATQSKWIRLKDVPKYYPVSILSLMRFGAQRRFHPRLARKQGGRWVFDLNVLLEEGLLLLDEQQ